MTDGGGGGLVDGGVRTGCVHSINKFKSILNIFQFEVFSLWVVIWFLYFRQSRGFRRLRSLYCWSFWRLGSLRLGFFCSRLRCFVGTTRYLYWWWNVLTRYFRGLLTVLLLLNINPFMLVAVEHSITKLYKIANIGQKPSPCPLITVIYIGGILQSVVLVPDVVLGPVVDDGGGPVQVGTTQAQGGKLSLHVFIKWFACNIFNNFCK